MTSNALEASQHRLLEMVHEAEDLSNVKNEFLNSYCTFSLTLIACSLCDLFQGAQQQNLPHRLSSR